MPDGTRAIAEQERKTRQVSVRQTGECFSCQGDETLLQGMLRLGRKGIPVGCVNGGCGVCKVRIHGGTCDKAGSISRAHVSVEEECSGVTLACRAIPRCDIEVEVIGKMQRGFLQQFGLSGKPD